MESASYDADFFVYLIIINTICLLTFFKSCNQCKKQKSLKF